jgi:hypothetical protein
MKPNRQIVRIAAAVLIALAASAYAQERVLHSTADDGSQVTVTSGQPKPNHYGPPPDFAKLDANNDGFVSREEAEAYMPLFNDFDYLAHHADRISKRQFENWVRTQGH